MSILNLFKKPNWKHKDANIRATSVAADTTDELINQLANISQNDESEIVRLAALRRLKDYTLITNIAKNDSHKTVSSAAYKMLQDWFKKSQDEQQLAIIKQLTDAKTIEIAAEHSENKAIREYCISKISKQGLLGDLLVNEKDKDLRKMLVDKIDKPATLKRIVKLIKNKDKTSFKAIQAKLENDGDTIKIINSKALELCEQMEKLIHNASTSSKNDVDKLDAKWQELSSDHDLTEMKQRYEGAHRTASLTFDPKQRDAFLDKQRQQKITSKISQLKDSLKDSENNTWEQIQTKISKYSGFDLSHATPEQKTEFNEFLDTLKALRDSKTNEQELPEKLLEIADKLDATLKHKYNQPDQITNFRKMWESQAQKVKSSSAFSTLKNRFDTAMLKLAEKVENSAALRDEAAKNAVAGIEKVSKLIKEGHLADAKVAINKIAENKKIAGFHQLIKDHKFDFDAVWNELKELRQWQTWSNDKIRIRLIEELKELIGTGTHPDALLKKMKESNKQWKDMEDHEKLEGDRYNVRNQELYTQFRAVQEALFTPAKEFFEKRSEIWDNELAQVETNVQALFDVDLIETSDRDLARQVRDAIKQLRSLDKIPPKNRGKIAAKIRSGIARIDEHLQESYKTAASRKEKLIIRAQELIDLEDLDSAIEQAKSLQQEWKNAGIVQQAQERKLWKSFRKANDAVFNRIKQQRDQVKAENKDLMDQAALLIATCDKNIKSEKEAHNINNLIERFKDDWSGLSIENRGLQSKANNLIEASFKKMATLANSEIINALKNSQKYAAICQDLELGKIEQEKAQEKWDKLKPLADKKMAKELSKRFENTNNTNDNFQPEANNILISGEYLTGLASPDEYKEERLAYQVDVLSRRMGGEESLNSIDQANDLVRRWFTLSGAEKIFIKDNDKRIKKVIKSLFDLLS